MRVEWDKAGEKLYETGTDHGVLYPCVAGVYGAGVPWNGLTSFQKSPEGAEPNAFYADNIKYANLMSAEDFNGSIGAYTYPKEFKPCLGQVSLAPGLVIGQQNRIPFGFCCRTKIGNDTTGEDYGYKLQIVYGALAGPSDEEYSTINDSPELIEFSWDISTTPVDVPGHKPTAYVELDSTKISSAKMGQIEDILYGTAATQARLPMPSELAQILGSETAFAVHNFLTNVENSNPDTVADGTYSATLTAKEGYAIENVIVAMGGEDITDSAYTSGTGAISIASVTGTIMVIATANET